MSNPTATSNGPRENWPLTEGSYLGRHWNGDLSLPVSFWLNGLVVSLIVNVIIMAVVYGAAASGARAALVVYLVLLAAGCAIGVWQLIGIWRSAVKHKRHTGRTGWGTAAQVVVVIAWIGLIASIPVGIQSAG